MCLFRNWDGATFQRFGWQKISSMIPMSQLKSKNRTLIIWRQRMTFCCNGRFDEVEILQKVAKHAEDPRWLEILKGYYPDRKQFNRDDTGVL